MKYCSYLFFVLVILAFGCGQDKQKPVTWQNLETAIINELTANAKYVAYAEKARKEGYQKIALLFDATAVSEKAHADRQLTELLSYGSTFHFTPPMIKTGKTAQNLEDAIAGESYEASQMYPDFINKAEEEKLESAVKVFKWARNAETKHQIYFQDALKALENQQVVLLPSEYQVCPQCGNTFNHRPAIFKCDICQNPREKFIVFR